VATGARERVVSPKVNDREVGVEEADDATTTWSP
jgi:hypothetical protein